MATEAYCVKCRTKREMKDEKKVTMKNGKPATQGVCPTCGTKMFKIAPASNSPPDHRCKVSRGGRPFKGRPPRCICGALRGRRRPYALPGEIGRVHCRMGGTHVPSLERRRATSVGACRVIFVI